uniref:Vacuolar iron transporter n=1 Tax=Solanum chacoense TaxID=4108 RepID=A0A0V0H7R1_SOLCH
MEGEVVKSIVYAGLDAIITSFSLISSISAGHLSSVDVLVLGFANLVADGISMGFGDYVSSSTEKDVAAKERTVTEWDVINQHRPQVVNIFAKYRDIMIDEKMAIQKGLLPPDQADKPWKSGLITFTAFIVFGCAPLLAFIVLIPFTKNDTYKFIGACVFSAVALALLGIAKAKIASQNYALSAGITLFNGLIAGAAAYGIGWTLRNVAGLEE